MTKHIKISNEANAILHKIRVEVLGCEEDPASYSRAIKYLARQAKNKQFSSPQ